MPGIIVQTMAFGGFVTALGLAEDLKKGLVDRFRSLPMSRSAVLAGRTLADVGTNLISLAIMIGVGMLAGFSFGAPLAHVIAGIGLMLLFGYAFSWVFAFIGLSSSSPLHDYGRCDAPSSSALPRVARSGERSRGRSASPPSLPPSRSLATSAPSPGSAIRA